MARAFPASTFISYDVTERSIDRAKAEAVQLGLTNVSFVVQDVSELGLRDAFDVITGFDAIHDLAKPRAVLRAVHAALRTGGTFFMADGRASSRLEENESHVLGPWFYVWSLAHCMTLSLGQNGEGLGSMWGEERALEYLSEAGFRDVLVRTKEADLINCYYICTKGALVNGG